MGSDLELSGPTVTLFGERDALDRAVCDELESRGCSTHVVTTAVGWFSSTTHAVIRSGTESGDRALQDLTASDTPSAHVVVVANVIEDGEIPLTEQPFWQDIGQQHTPALVQLDPADQDQSATRRLAAAIADHVLEHIELGSGT